jgi:Holliday junction resolvase
MDAPRQPVPADFGIAEKDVGRLSKLVFGFPEDSLFGWGLWAPTTILIALILLNLQGRGDWGHGYWILALFMVMPVVLFSSFLTACCFAVLGGIESKIRVAISPAFRRALQYRSAMDGYHKNVAEYEHWIAAQEEAYWRGLSGVAFENELARLFRGVGYKVSATPPTGDGGIDLILRKDGRVTVVQCKAHDRKIPIGVARELIASMQDFNAHDAIIACLEGVTKPVQQYIATKPIRVIDVRDILLLQRSLR